MSVSVDIRQQTATLDGPLYQVKSSVVAATGISSALFVFKAATDAFDHFATLADLSRYPDTKAAALTQGLGFYRLAAVQRNWPTVDLMNQDLMITIERMQAVVDEWNAGNTTVALDRTITLTSGT
jgi:hypothetical protein